MTAWCYQVGSGLFDWAEARPGTAGGTLASAQFRPRTLSELISGIDVRDRSGAEAAIDRALKESGPVSLHVRLAEGPMDRWVCLRAGKMQCVNGLSLCGVIYDAPETEAREPLHALIGQIDHATRNLLTNIAALAAQSIEPGLSLASYADQLSGRIRALSCVYDLLSRNDWRGITLSELVSELLNMAGYDGSANVAIEGPRVLLKPRAGQTLALGLHELAAPSVSAGVLAGRGGRLDIRWSMPVEGEWLGLVWEETGLGSARPPSRTAFGSVVLDTLLPEDLDAEVTYQSVEGGRRCEIRLPLEWVAAETHE